MAQILKFKGDYNGLDTARAEENLSFYGHNSDVKHDERAGFRARNVFLSMRFFLMLGAISLTFIGGNLSGGIMLSLLTVTHCAAEILKGVKCDEKLAELTRSSEITVRAVRDGGVILLKREHIVQDDLIVLQGGENVPADAHILESYGVTADESAFTGSPLPVKKAAGADGKNELKQSCVYKGTRIVSGILIARVFATGQDSKANRGHRSAKDGYYTEFEAAFNKLMPIFTCCAAVVLIITTAFKFITAVPPETDIIGYFTETFLPAVSFALCVLPVEAASIVRIYYITGALRLSRKYGEIKHLRALETLNSVTAVCVGKDSIIAADNTPLVGESSANKEMLTRISALSCGTSPADSYEKAIFLSAAFKHIDVKEMHENELIKSYGSDDEARYHKINGCLWGIGGSRLLCVKGEPEVVLSFCKPPTEQLFTIQKKQHEYAREGYRVFAVAFAKIENDRVPESLFEIEYTYLGLTAFSGNIRENVQTAVRNCYRAGVNVVMLTPDGKETALAAAEKIGLKSGGVITGEELERAKFDGDKTDVSEVNVFSGITAGQKGEITNLMRSSGEIVAVFGGESSDVEALEQADVGIALSKYTTEREWDMDMDTLSQSTTGSACEACDFIMEGDGFVKAADTFREARQMHRNIKRGVSAAISALITIAPFALVNLLSGGGFVLDAVFASFLTVVAVPVMMLIFIDNKADLKSWLKPSGFIGRGAVNKNFLFGAIIQGGSLLFAELAMFFAMPEKAVVTQRSVFAAVFFSGIIAMAWVGLSFEKPFYRFFNRRNNSVISLSVLMCLLLLLVIYMPFVNSALGLARLNPLTLMLCLAVGTVSQIWFDFVKKRFSH
ncbi:MAG: cation-translocating P-type ATPase [Oscillospiraceae bacterium]|jgi:Ca2+-transporting ATPase|nr:cation-translocating P-type ATPase [Oscillospiraceae bacterium]